MKVRAALVTFVAWFPELPLTQDTNTDVVGALSFVTAMLMYLLNLLQAAIALFTELSLKH
jgi:hypothetical protein